MKEDGWFQEGMKEVQNCQPFVILFFWYGDLLIQILLLEGPCFKKAKVTLVKKNKGSLLKRLTCFLCCSSPIQNVAKSFKKAQLKLKISKSKFHNQKFQNQNFKIKSSKSKFQNQNFIIENWKLNIEDQRSKIKICKLNSYIWAIADVLKYSLQ